MNVLTLRSQTRLKSGVSTSDYSNADILTQLNEGYYTLTSIIAQINEDFFEEQKDKFNLVTNSSLYAQPTDLLKFKQLRLSYSTPTDESSYRVASPYDPSRTSNVSTDETNISVSNPLVDITNNYFRIFPKPTAAVTNGGEIYYIARPSALVNTGDSPVIPTEFHDLLSDYATMQIGFKFEYWNKQAKAEERWLRGIERIKTDLAERNINSEERMRNPLEIGINNVVRELY